MLKTDRSGAFLDIQVSFRVASARDCEGVVACPKNDGRGGTFEEDLER